MSELDRSIPPQSKVEDNIHLKEINHIKLSNGVPLYYISAGIDEVIKIEFSFEAGSKFQNKVLLANAVNELLKNGTEKKTQFEISSEIDKYGAFIESYINSDVSLFIVYTLTKYLPNVLAYVKEMLFESVFPERELKNYLRYNRQTFLINNQKVNYLARKAFQVQLFGADHPYGKVVNIGDFDNLKREDLLEFYQSHYTADDLTIYASGNVGEEQQAYLEEFFGSGIRSKKNPIEEWKHQVHVHSGNSYVEKEDAMQSAIRIGRRLFTKKHPDFIGLQFLSTVLGGYFGSRLMRNIREDKGYTYGIGAGLVSQLHEGYFYIATEVGVDVTEATIAEIYKEMQSLCEQKIPEKELELVKNYIYGRILRSFDGPFSAMDKFISIHKFGFDNEYFHKQLREIASMNADYLMSLANKYLQASNMIEIIVGNKKKPNLESNC